MTTKTKTKKASAPETRTRKNYKIPKQGLAQLERNQKWIDEEKRTIPAEKPTDWRGTDEEWIKATEPTSVQTLIINAESWRKVALRREAQSAQLAEALKQAQAWLIACSDKDYTYARHYTYARQAVAIKAREALAAYEEGK